MPLEATGLCIALQAGTCEAVELACLGKEITTIAAAIWLNTIFHFFSLKSWVLHNGSFPLWPWTRATRALRKGSWQVPLAMERGTKHQGPPGLTWWQESKEGDHQGWAHGGGGGMVAKRLEEERAKLGPMVAGQATGMGWVEEKWKGGRNAKRRRGIPTKTTGRAGKAAQGGGKEGREKRQQGVGRRKKQGRREVVWGQWGGRGGSAQEPATSNLEEQEWLPERKGQKKMGGKQGWRAGPRHWPGQAGGLGWLKNAAPGVETGRQGNHERNSGVCWKGSRKGSCGCPGCTGSRLAKLVPAARAPMAAMALAAAAAMGMALQHAMGVPCWRTAFVWLYVWKSSWILNVYILFGFMCVGFFSQ